MISADDLERPERWGGAPVDALAGLHYSPSRRYLLGALENPHGSGAGIWGASGNLIAFFVDCSRLAWLPDESGFFRVSQRQQSLHFELWKWPGSQLRDGLAMPCPTARVGGYMPMVAPNGAYAAVSIYSGQSEARYELFQLTPQLCHLGGMAYRHAEGGFRAMAFSPDSALFALASSEARCWWVGDDDADYDVPAKGGEVEWAALYLHRIGEDSPRRYSLRTRVALGFLPTEALADHPWARGLRFVDAQTVELDLPWGGSARVKPADNEVLLLPPPA